MITHCLEDNFKTFLDKSYYTITDPASKKQQHSVYSEDPSEIFFNHHNPLKEEDNIYFNRCITRFKNMLAQPELKMFVLFFLNFTKIDKWFKQKIIDFNKQLGNHTQNFGLLCIIQYTSDKNSYRFTIHDNVHFLEIYTTSNSNGVEFENPEDNIFLDNLIMTTYQFSLIDIAPLPSVDHAVHKNIIIEKGFKDAHLRTDDIHYFEKINLQDNRLFQKSMKSFPALERYQSVLHKEVIDIVIEEPNVEEIVIDDSTLSIETPIIVEKKKNKKTNKILTAIKTSILGMR